MYLKIVFLQHHGCGYLEYTPIGSSLSLQSLHGERRETHSWICVPHRSSGPLYVLPQCLSFLLLLALLICFTDCSMPCFSLWHVSLLCMWSPEANAVSLLAPSLGKVSQLNLQLIVSASLSNQFALGILFSPSKCWNYSGCHLHQVFHVDAGELNSGPHAGVAST